MISTHITKKIEEILGRNYRIEYSDYDDGPPSRIKIMKREKGWFFYHFKEIGYIDTDIGKKNPIHLFLEHSLAEVLAKEFPNKEIILH